MSLFFRRSVKMGPLRFTASKTGVSVSAGIRGMRVTAGPRGTYVSLGAGGFTYRTRVDGGRRRPAPMPHAPGAPGLDAAVDPGRIATASAVALAASSPDQSLREISDRVNRISWFKVYLVLSATMLLLVAPALAVLDGWLAVVTVALFALLAVPVFLWDRERRTARVFYDVDNEELLVRFSIVNAIGEALSRTALLWHVYSSVGTSDTKRNAGASQLVRRTVVRCRPGPLRGIECNIEPWSVPVGPQKLVFLPDRLVVNEGRQLAAVPYEALQVYGAPTRFVEDGVVPRDAWQVDTTWRYVNNSGGPDRRFRDNRQLPVLEYGELMLLSAAGIRIVLQTSSVEAARRAKLAFDELRRVAGRDRGQLAS